jgi:hypothetical protein
MIVVRGIGDWTTFLDCHTAFYTCYDRNKHMPTIVQLLKLSCEITLEINLVSLSFELCPIFFERASISGR